MTIFGITPAELGAILSQAGAITGLVGGGVWKLIQRADARAKEREAEIEKRSKDREADLISRIEKVEAANVELHKEIRRLLGRERVMLHRVVQLEEFMRAKGIEAPPLQGWPLPIDGDA